jgi:hypothetical protein
MLSPQFSWVNGLPDGKAKVFRPRASDQAHRDIGPTICIRRLSNHSEIEGHRLVPDWSDIIETVFDSWAIKDLNSSGISVDPNGSGASRYKR